MAQHGNHFSRRSAVFVEAVVTGICHWNGHWKWSSLEAVMCYLWKLSRRLICFSWARLSLKAVVIEVVPTMDHWYMAVVLTNVAAVASCIMLGYQNQHCFHTVKPTHFTLMAFPIAIAASAAGAAEGTAGTPLALVPRHIPPLALVPQPLTLVAPALAPPPPRNLWRLIVMLPQPTVELICQFTSQVPPPLPPLVKRAPSFSADDWPRGWNPWFPTVKPCSRVLPTLQ